MGAVTPARGPGETGRGGVEVEVEVEVGAADREKSAAIGHFFTCYLLTFGPALSYLTDRRSGPAQRRFEHAYRK